MTQRTIQSCLMWFLLSGLCACPTQLEVDDSDKNGMLPIGGSPPDVPDDPEKQTPLDAGQTQTTVNENPDAGPDGGLMQQSPETDAAVPDDPDGAGDGTEIITDPTLGLDGGQEVFTPETDAGTTPDAPLVDAGSDESNNANEPWTEPTYPDGPSTPGSYVYDRLAVGGFEAGSAVAIHPDGSYALVLERNDVVHVITFSNMQMARFELASSNDYSFTDVRFHPSGHVALLVGHQDDGSDGDKGLMIQFDDAVWRSGSSDAALLFSEIENLPSTNKVPSLRFPQNPNEPAIVLFVGGTSDNHTAILRKYDVDLNEFTFWGSTTDSIEMGDLAIVKNEFGGFGVLIVGGNNGTNFRYYTEIGGMGEWRNHPGFTGGTTGNISYVEAHPSGDYALPIAWSGNRIYRFEGAQMCSTGDAVSYGINDIRCIAFQPNGQRALIFGGHHNGTGYVYEYRHDRFECGYQGCDITFVPIDNFESAPYLAAYNTNLVDGAWRSDCEGGLLVANEPGLVITFQVEGGTSCWD